MRLLPPTRSRALGGDPEPTFWAEFDLAGGEEPIRRMMAICGQALVERHRELPGYPFGLGHEIDLWGPKATAAYKKLLHELGFYSGPVDGNKDDELNLSITDMFDAARQRCKNDAFVAKEYDYVCSGLTTTIIVEGKEQTGTPRVVFVTSLLDADRTKLLLGELQAGD